MRVLILGSTGLLGHALVSEASLRGYKVIGAARHGADFTVDVSSVSQLENLVETIKPHLIINAAALVSLESCEANPDLAYQINARPSAVISNLSLHYDFDFIHISSDHFFSGDGNLKHPEEYPVVLLNEYARTKYCAEKFALTSPKAMVVRTNIVGFSPRLEQPAFVDRIVKILETKEPLVLFDDFYTSSLDVGTFAQALFDLFLHGYRGTINLASKEVSSKREFIQNLASQLKLDLSKTRVGSLMEMTGPKRAESLGLDIAKAQNILSYELPSLREVVERLIAQNLRQKEKTCEVR